jgi:RHS repeat-associated protein
VDRCPDRGGFRLSNANGGEHPGKSGHRGVRDRAQRQTQDRVRRKVLDGEQEAKIIALRLGQPPKGFSNWTLRLLAERAVALEIVASVSYEAFGVSRVLAPDFTPEAGSSFDWKFLFHAEFLDQDTDLYNYGYRYYLAQLGRWLSRDPLVDAELSQGLTFIGSCRMIQ